MHDIGDASGILHVQEGTMDQQVLGGQLNGINALSSGGISSLLNEVITFLIDMYLVYAYEILN